MVNESDAYGPSEGKPPSVSERRHKVSTARTRVAWLARGLIASLPFIVLMGVYAIRVPAPALSPAPVLGVIASLWLYHRLTPYVPKLDGHTRCGECGYILKGLVEPRCTECGRRI